MPRREAAKSARKSSALRPARRRRLWRGVLALRVEKVLLGVLVGAERNDVQDARFRDLGNALQRGFHGGQAKVVAQQGVGRFPGDAFQRGLRVVSGIVAVSALAAQECQHFLGGFAAVEGALKEAQLARAFRHWRGAAEHKAHTLGAQVVRGFSKFAQQALACFGRQTVRSANQVGVLFARGAQEFFQRDSRPEEDGAPARELRQVEKIHYAGNMDAFPQGARNNGFHEETSCLVL